MKKRVTLFLLSAVVVFAAGLVPSSALAQGTSAPREIQVADVDTAAADQATLVHSQVFFARNDVGSALRQSSASSRAKSLAGQAASLQSAAGDQPRSPGDLTNFFGGPTVGFAESHPIFLSSKDGTTCAPNSCWGDPDTFLALFGHSSLSHVTDQYVGQHADDRYTLGAALVLPFTPTPSTAPLIDANIRAIVHAAALQTGDSGLNHIFHVFLPPGQDECFSAAATTCYSPDKPASFAFCAYHSSVHFKDIGEVLYSVEPFQNVSGCQVRPGTVNGQLIDSTNSTLSHELIETITDPEGNAWFNLSNNALAGEEIADECDFFVIVPSGNHLLVFGDPMEFAVGQHRFATQSEYSNLGHACAVRP
jgi:hypothetical protein